MCLETVTGGYNPDFDPNRPIWDNLPLPQVDWGEVLQTPPINLEDLYPGGFGEGPQPEVDDFVPPFPNTNDDLGVPFFDIGNTGDNFVPPQITRNRHGQLTNGTYTLDQSGMTPHTTGSFADGKSQFLSGVDADRAVLDAAAYADQHGLWNGPKATVPVSNGPVGVHGRTGELTDPINVYRNRNGCSCLFSWERK